MAKKSPYLEMAEKFLLVLIASVAVLLVASVLMGKCDSACIEAVVKEIPNLLGSLRQ